MEIEMIGANINRQKSGLPFSDFLFSLIFLSPVSGIRVEPTDSEASDLHHQDFCSFREANSVHTF